MREGEKVWVMGYGECEYVCEHTEWATDHLVKLPGGTETLVRGHEVYKTREDMEAATHHYTLIKDLEAEKEQLKKQEIERERAVIDTALRWAGPQATTTSADLKKTTTALLACRGRLQDLESRIQDANNALIKLRKAK